jgi:hypothetical protein
VRDGFDGAGRADGHEDRRFGGSVGKVEASAATAGGGCSKKLERWRHEVILVDSGHWTVNSCRETETSY